MRKQSEVDDSLEFCKEIKYYEEKEHPLEFKNDTDEYSELKEYLEWVDKTDELIGKDYEDYQNAMNRAVSKEVPPPPVVETPQVEEPEETEEYDLFEEAIEEKEPMDSFEEELEHLAEPEKTVTRKRTIFRNMAQILGCVLIAFVIVYSVTTYLVTYTRVHGESMENTLIDGDVVLINRIGYRFHEPEEFDTIVFHHPSGVNLVKRIIAKPGETVQIVNGTIFVNGEVINENYGKDAIENSGQAELPITLGDDEYFVLGDNRNASTDSRSTYVGLVKRKDIVGKVMFRVYPFNHIGTIE